MDLQALLSDKYFRQHSWEFFLILEDILGIKKEEIYIKNFEISDEQLTEIKEKYDKFVKQKIPIEYVLGYTYFMGERFFVNENVLIPRPETEYLVKYALERANRVDVIFDVGTGSWIIWIMLWKLTWKKVVLSDISEKALKIAEKNAKKVCPKCNFEFVLADLWAHIKNYSGKKLICANLPYVDENFELDEYAQKEPSLALFAPDEGLALYKKLLNQIQTREFLFELTQRQATRLKKINPNFEVLPTCHQNIKILYGKKW